MARGTTLAVIVSMVKAEMMLDSDDTVSPGGDANLKAQISNQQKWLAQRYDWPFLTIERDINTVAGTRYYDFPVTSMIPDIELGRDVVGAHYWATLWYPVEKGITKVEYSFYNPVLNQRCDPIRKWQFYRPVSGALQFEVWPLPATDGMFRLTGQKTLPVLAADGDTAELDDLLIAQFTAAKMMARMGSKDAQAELAEANSTLNQLRAGYTAPNTRFSMNSGQVRPKWDWQRPTVAVNYTP